MSGQEYLWRAVIRDFNGEALDIFEHEDRQGLLDMLAYASVSAAHIEIIRRKGE